MHEDDRSVATQHDVGLPGKSGYMSPVSESLSVQCLPDRNFWHCVLAPDCPHYPATGLPVELVNHLLHSTRRVATPAVPPQPPGYQPPPQPCRFHPTVSTSTFLARPQGCPWPSFSLSLRCPKARTGKRHGRRTPGSMDARDSEVVPGNGAWVPHNMRLTALTRVAVPGAFGAFALTNLFLTHTRSNTNGQTEKPF